MATVLVVDDEFGVADLVDAILTDEGHRVLTAANRRQGLAVLARERADLVFLDTMMPVTDGGAMRQAVVGHPELRRIPVVMMSSRPEASVAERCSGNVAFLRKAVPIAQITGLARRLVSSPEG